MDVMSMKAAWHQFYDGLAVGICLLGREVSQPVLFVNKSLLKMYHCADEAAFSRLTGQSFKGMFESNDADSILTMTSMTEENFVRFRFRTADGDFQQASGAVRLVSFGDDLSAWLLQITSSEAKSELSGLDYLTGTLSMHRFFERAAQVAKLEGPKGKLSSYCPTYFNLTNFRLYNAMHGRDAGDRCLKRIAAVLQQQFPMALVARLSADGFAVLASREDLLPKVEFICRKVSGLIKNQNILLKAGICLLGDDDAEKIRDAFDLAKVACDTVKANATRCWAIYSQDMSKSMKNRNFVLENFDKALEKGYIKVYYQPVIRSLTGKICSFEALARWEDPVYGLLSPAVFVPVLEKAHLIQRLDRYVISSVGSHLRYNLINRKTVVPVSINLSRYDFDLMDPFSIVEDVVHHYDLPREYFCIEITETALVKDKQNLIQALGKFRKAGYQLWLDDFGSAYSSLNVLHNYHFDELKIDMAFLRNFNDESRKIITAIVLMAKTLGVHTLAEGAETKEQVEFLKSVGCEKIQGYYFGQPLPYDAALEFSLQYAYGMETRLEEHIYDKAGMINVVTDLPIAIFRYDGQKAEYLLKNDMYRHTQGSLQTWDRKENGHDEIVPDISVQRRLQKFIEKAVASKKEEMMTYVENGQYIRIFLDIIGGAPGFYVGCSRIYNISYDQTAYNLQHADALLRNVLVIFDGLYYLDNEADTMEIIRTLRSDVDEGDKIHDIRQDLSRYAAKFLHEDDRERFLQFMDMDYLKRRIRTRKRPEVSAVFRVRQDDGNYCWNVFIVVMLPGRKRGSYNILLGIYESVWEAQENRRELLPIVANSFGIEMTAAPQSDRKSPLIDFARAMLRHSGINFFWKDKERRFLGASQSFLDYYGIPNVEAIIGKTDEEMGWHINYHEFMKEEDDVLERGLISRDVVGQCIVRGRPHPIMATKVPVYHGEKIIGLLGYFYDLDKLHAKRQKIEDLQLIDQETQLLNLRGILLIAVQYANNYRTYGDDYTCVLLDVPEIDDVRLHYGVDAAKLLLQEVTEIIVQMNPLKESIAHLGNCRFMYIRNGAESDRFREQMLDLANKIHAITSIQGCRCTLNLQYAMAKGSEGRNFNDILKLLSVRLSEAQAEQYGQKSYIGERLLFDREKFDHAASQVAIIDPKTYDVVYANPKLCRDRGFADTLSWMGEKCYRLFYDEEAPCADCDNANLSRSHFRSGLCHDRMLGRDVFKRSTLIPWQARNYRFTETFDLSKYINRDIAENRAVFREAMANDVIAAGMREIDPAKGLQQMIACMGRNLHAERVLIFEEGTDDTVSATFEWCRPGLAAVMAQCQKIPRSSLQPLYAAFGSRQLAVIDDFAAFRRKCPGLSARLPEIRHLVSGHLTQSGKSLGFTAIINSADLALKSAGLLLSTLTLFFAIMLRNRETIKALETMGTTDPMTQLGNRRGFLEYLRSLPEGRDVAFIFGDINGLKRVNDTQGHEAGDRLICQAAQLLDNLTAAGRAFRMGGDEFLLLLVNQKEAEVRRMLQELQKRCQANGMSIALGCSVRKTPVDDIDAVLSEVDRKMYDDKGKIYSRRRTDRRWNRRENDGKEDD